MTIAINKFKLLIDMDGVLAQWYPGLLNIYRERYPDRPFIAPEDVTRFYVEELYPEEHKADVMRIAREKGFYLSLPVMEGAQEALKDIEENCLDFIDPFICTSPEVEFDDLMCHSEKVQWTRKNFGNYWVKQSIITKDKTVVIGDLIIDDKPEIKGCMSPTWIQMHYAQPYNPAGNGGGEVKKGFTWADWPAVRELIRKSVEEENEALAGE